MVNPFQMLQQVGQVMKNPMQAIIDQQAQRMRQANPDLYNRTMQMINGKSDAQLKEMAENMARERGIDLSQLASQFGLKF